MFCLGGCGKSERAWWWSVWVDVERVRVGESLVMVRVDVDSGSLVVLCVVVDME